MMSRCDTFGIGWRNVVEVVLVRAVTVSVNPNLGKWENLAYGEWWPLGQDLQGQRHPRLLFSFGDLARVVQRVTPTKRCLMRDNRLPRIK